MELLSHLTEVENTSTANFSSLYSEVFSQEKVVLIAKTDREYVGTGSLMLVRNFIHGPKPYGLIDDVVVRPQWRGCGVGKDIMNFLLQIAELQNCYKVILSCSDDNKSFYERLGFYSHEIVMRLDLE